MHEAVKRGGQFIIATHSPVLLAYPGATIYEITIKGIAVKPYDQLDQVQLMRQFLQAPEAFFHHMFTDK
jgi:predicted ATPase